MSGGYKLIDFLLKIILKNDRDYENNDNRLKVGYLASIVSLIINLLLTIIKLSIGFFISSIGVIADGFNNLSDTASSVITLLGFKVANMPPDKEHPYGHARAEYISALIVALLVVLVGLQFVKASVERIINPKLVKFEVVSFTILLISIFFKVWMAHFNKVLGEKINSSSLKATSADAMGDVLTTSIVVLSIFIGRYTSLAIDGFIGLIVAIIIIYSGYSLVKDTISSLIGEAPSPELIESIYKDIVKYDHITGAHDLVIHSYGVGRTMATIDVEFPSTIDVITIHDVIDDAERELGEKYNMILVIHMDPLDMESKERYNLRKKIKSILSENPKVKSMHDFMVLDSQEKEEVIEFHLVIDGNKLEKNDTEDLIKASMEDIIEENCKGFTCNIIVDIEY